MVYLDKQVYERERWRFAHRSRHVEYSQSQQVHSCLGSWSPNDDRTPFFLHGKELEAGLIMNQFIVPARYYSVGMGFHSCFPRHHLELK